MIFGIFHVAAWKKIAFVIKDKIYIEDIFSYILNCDSSTVDSNLAISSKAMYFHIKNPDISIGSRFYIN